MSSSARDIGMVMCCYGQPQMMAVQKKSWDAFPEEFQRRLQVIVIDDCGEPAFTCDEDTPYELQIYRVTKDIPWNQPGAKNLGFQKATATWIINMDPDMVFKELAIRQILQQMPDVERRGRGMHYKFGLDHRNGSRTMDHSSPNFYLIHREDFWRCGGYNEDFSGHKGFSDVVLHRVLHYMTKRVFWKISAEFFSTTDEVPDAAVMKLDRSIDNNGKLFQAAVNFASQHNWSKYPATFQKHGYVRFPWTQVR